jgi:hypothetical protein
VISAAGARGRSLSTDPLSLRIPGQSPREWVGLSLMLHIAELSFLQAPATHDVVMKRSMLASDSQTPKKAHSWRFGFITLIRQMSCGTERIGSAAVKSGSRAEARRLGPGKRLVDGAFVVRA